MFVDSFQFSMAGRGESTCAVVSPCILLLSLFTSGSTVGIFPHALSDQSKSSLVNWPTSEADVVTCLHLGSFQVVRTRANSSDGEVKRSEPMKL